MSPFIVALVAYFVSSVAARYSLLTTRSRHDLRGDAWMNGRTGDTGNNRRKHLPGNGPREQLFRDQLICSDIIGRQCKCVFFFLPSFSVLNIFFLVLPLTQNVGK